MDVSRRSSIPIAAFLALAACDQIGSEPTGPVLGAGGVSASHVPSLAAEICDPDNGGLTLPDDFCALTVFDAVRPTGAPAQARHIAVAPNGDIFVAIQSQGGGVLALRDTTGDGKPDVTATFGSSSGHGIYYKDPFLYFAPNDRVERYLMSEESVEPVSGPEVIVSGMPTNGDHRTKTIVVTDDGSLFVNLGSASDVCQEENREVGSPGVDPCPELPIRSGVWRYNADQPGQVHNEGARFVSGTRNMVALALNSANGELYGVQHGRDNLNRYWPDQFSPQDQAELPAEEFFRFREGRVYGWPYCYYDGRKDKKVLAPEYGGNGNGVTSRCAHAEKPIMTFAAHLAPNGLHFYSGSQFPEQYSGGAFIAFHGGFNRPDPFRDEGFNVVFVPFRNGMPSGPAQVFADGFVGEDAENLPGDADHRPVGLAEGPDGSLYITDDAGGRIWRVLHR